MGKYDPLSGFAPDDFGGLPNAIPEVDKPLSARRRGIFSEQRNALTHLCVRKPLPFPEAALAQARTKFDFDLAGFQHDLSGSKRAPKIGRSRPIEGLPRQEPSEGLRLLHSSCVELGIGVALGQSEAVPFGLAMPNKKYSPALPLSANALCRGEGGRGDLGNYFQTH